MSETLGTNVVQVLVPIQIRHLHPSSRSHLSRLPQSLRATFGRTFRETLRQFSPALWVSFKFSMCTGASMRDVNISDGMKLYSTLQT